MVLEIVISVVLLLVGIAVLVVIHIFIVGRLLRMEHQNQALDWDSRSGQQLSSSTPKMSSEDLSKLPCFDHVGGGGRGTTRNQPDCSVCLESFKAGEKYRSLPDCGNYFHAHCIESWLVTTPICPICRASVNFPAPRKNLPLEESMS